LLIEIVKRDRKVYGRVVRQRPLLQFAFQNDRKSLEAALSLEESQEREADRRYWQPLRAELESFRRRRVQDR
jgi:hypothetical protein